MSRILLVEDDRTISRELTEFLRAEGFELETADTQRQALERLETGSYDLLLLDISLPDGSGYSVCSAARQSRQIPVIFLSASGDEYSVITGLDLGADDYISKPFRPRELVSRIRSVLRRSGKTGPQMVGALVVDVEKGTVTRAGKEVLLSALEYRLLLVFLNHRGRVLSRGQLLEEIWDVAGEFVNDNTLTVYIKRLREKIGDDSQSPTLIKTVRGMGYKLEE